MATSRGTHSAPASTAGSMAAHYKGMGVQAGGVKYPPAAYGDYLARFKGIRHDPSEKPNDDQVWAKGDFEVVEFSSDERAPGDTITWVQAVALKAKQIGPEMIKQMIMAVAGFTLAEQADYDEWDPDCDYIGAAYGEKNAYSAPGVTPIGSPVRIHIGEGKPVPEVPGTFFPLWVFSPYDPSDGGTAGFAEPESEPTLAPAAPPKRRAR
jgi:hypothetical protein